MMNEVIPPKIQYCGWMDLTDPKADLGLLPYIYLAVAFLPFAAILHCWSLDKEPDGF